MGLPIATTSSNEEAKISSLRPALWLDPQNVNLRASGGDNFVTAWLDKSGHRFHAVQGTTTLQPKLLSNTLNGHPVVKFDNTDDIMSLTNTGAVGIFRNKEYGYIFIVGKMLAVANDITFIHFSIGTHNNRARLTPNVNSSEINTAIRRLDEDAIGRASYGSFNSNYNLISSLGLWGEGFGGIKLNNESLITSALSTSGPTSDTDSMEVNIGRVTTSNAPLNGEIAEILVFNHYLSPAQIFQIEKYLNRKYLLYWEPSHFPEALSTDTIGGSVSHIIQNNKLYKVHTFLESGDFEVRKNVALDYLVVAGGGGGGVNTFASSAVGSGGGGAGGVIEGSGSFSGLYSVIVGDGGGEAESGENSSLYNIEATGGGFGSSRFVAGESGGSGGGGSHTDTTGLSGTEGQGNKGGNYTAGTGTGSGAGGGGKGAAGSNGATGNPANGGNGGSGIVSNINGTSISLGGGGGGGSSGTGGTGGSASHGGGAGGTDASNGQNGTPNTGGGGGGSGRGANPNPVAGQGGSGIVIVRREIPVEKKNPWKFPIGTFLYEYTFNAGLESWSKVGEGEITHSDGKLVYTKDAASAGGPVRNPAGHVPNWEVGGRYRIITTARSTLGSDYIIRLRNSSSVANWTNITGDEYAFLDSEWQDFVVEFSIVSTTGSLYYVSSSGSLQYEIDRIQIFRIG